MRALAAALAAIAKHWRLVLVTLLIQFFVAGLAALAVWLITSGLAGGSALFEKAVDGDIAAIITLLIENPALTIAPSMIALVAILAYAAISWFMSAGLIGVFQSFDDNNTLAQFGHWGARRFFAFARLALWSLPLYVLVVVILRFRLGGIGTLVGETFTMQAFYLALLTRLLPALVVLWIGWTIVDVARVLLVDAERASAWRAVGGAAKTIVSKPSLLAITLAGHLLSVLVIFTSFRLLGIGGGIGAFAIRQVFFAARHAIHVGVVAAEVDRLER